MSARLATLSLALLVGIAFAAATSLVVSAAWPWARRRLAVAHPAARAAVAWVAAAAPVLLPALLVALCFLPGLLGAVGLVHDHCTHHPDHPHLCLIHATAPLTPARAALLVSAALLAALAVLPDALRLVRQLRWLARLPRATSTSRPHLEEAGDVEIIDCETPFAFAAGLWHPRVHIAVGLLRALPERLLAAVLAHERAHARRRDSLLQLTARVLSRAHLPGVRRSLLAELALASEQACDAEAGGCIGDRLAVAEAILAVERLLGGAAGAVPPGITAFGGSAVTERVHGLLADEVRPARQTLWRVAVSMSLLVPLVMVNGLHHAAEYLLAIVTRWV